MKEITVTVTFKIGTLKEIGMGGLKQDWVTANGHDGNRLNLTVGAGLGNSLIEASCATRGGRSVYAKASVVGLAQQVFEALEAAAVEGGRAGAVPDVTK